MKRFFLAMGIQWTILSASVLLDCVVISGVVIILSLSIATIYALAEWLREDQLDSELKRTRGAGKPAHQL